MLKQGLYEQVVNTEIKDELRQLPEDSKHIEKIDAAESSSVLTQYLSEVVHKGLDRIAGDDISAQLNLVNKIVDLISQETAQDDLRDFTVDDEGEQLFALLSRDDPMMRIGRKKAKDLPRPETSIAQSSLFTGAIHKPHICRITEMTFYFYILTVIYHILDFFLSDTDHSLFYSFF